MNQSVAFLKAVDDLHKMEIPREVVARAKRSLLDYLAVTCAGAKFQEDKLEQYMAFAQPENGSFKVIGLHLGKVLKEAVFLNGLNAHALDYDDGTNSGIIHLGSPIFSVLIPLSQRYKKDLDDVLKAAIIGYEVSYTLAVSIQPRHKMIGYHATGTCGTVGAAIAASYLLDFSDEERFQTFAAACVAAGGMLKALDDGSELKPYNVAKAALLALTSLQLGKSGFKGSSDPLGGRGFWYMMTGERDIVIKPLLLNGTYAIMKSYTKPYASCRYTHPAVEAAIRMRDKIEPAEIKEIDIRTYDLAVSGHDHTAIPGSYSAKMSIPYATAAGLIFGKAGLQEFSEEQLQNKTLMQLTQKVKVTADETLSAVFPRIQAAVVTINTGKERFSERVDYPKGEPENPLTDDEFRDRYDGLMNYAGIAENVSRRIYEAVNNGGITIQELINDL